MSRAATAASLERAWRIVATGLSFALFGLGGLLLTVAVFPCLGLLPQAARRRRARAVIRWSFRGFIGFMEAFGVMRLEVSDVAALRNSNGMLVVANHPTLIDVVALLALLPDANCVVKQSLWRNPFLGGVVRAAGYISNSDPEQLVRDCANALAAGSSLIIFPEGTRSVAGQPIRFSRGVAYIVLAQAVPVLPVLIRCTPPTLAKGEPWYRIPHSRFHLRLCPQPALDAAAMLPAGAALPSAIAARRLTRILENYFVEALAHYG